MFPQSARLKSTFTHDILPVALYIVLVVICMFEGTLEEVHVEAVLVGSLYHGVDCCVSHFMSN